ncbi:MAG: LCP family protein [Bifidobacteriaceae bacterium]|jgi:LCP family protein required for cell wall assembly|nr:LCP family protein [Bifidobacteriaceae bacterium]
MNNPNDNNRVSKRPNSNGHSSNSHSSNDRSKHSKKSQKKHRAHRINIEENSLLGYEINQAKLSKSEAPLKQKIARKYQGTLPSAAAASVNYRSSIHRRIRIVLIFLITFALAVTLILLNDIFYSADTITWNPLSQEDRAPIDDNAGKSLNILLIGIDSRDGDNVNYSGGDKLIGNYQSDTSILLHISSDRKRVEAISLPRDLIVDVPSCKMTDGTYTKARDDVMLNSAFATVANASGGNFASAAWCTALTVEKATNVRINDFILADFAGFAKMVDSVNGIDICVPNKIAGYGIDGFDLDAGMQHLDGLNALKLARARHGKGLGDQSDLSRIKRQQRVLGALATKLTNFKDLKPTELYNFGKTSFESLTTSISPKTLQGLMWSLKNLKMNNVIFETAPIEAYVKDKNRVQFKKDATDLFTWISADMPIVEQQRKAAEEAAAKAGKTTTPNSTTEQATPETTPEATTTESDDYDISDPTKDDSFVNANAGSTCEAWD